MRMPANTPLVCNKSQSCPRDRKRQSCRHEQPHSDKAPDCKCGPCAIGGGVCAPLEAVFIHDEQELLEPMPGEADADVRKMLDWWLDYLDGAVDISNERELP